MQQWRVLFIFFLNRISLMVHPMFVTHSHTNRSQENGGINCTRIYTFNNSDWYWTELNIFLIHRKSIFEIFFLPSQNSYLITFENKYYELQSLFKLMYTCTLCWLGSELILLFEDMKPNKVLFRSGWGVQDCGTRWCNKGM